MTTTVKKGIVLDATNRPIGRLASLVATYLRGKNLVTFTPNILPNVYVRVTNISRAHLSIQRSKQSIYHFSGYPGGLKEKNFGRAFAQNPTAQFRQVVRRMLPDNRSRKQLMRFLIIED